MPHLKPGATGEDVRVLQVALNNRARTRGLPTVRVDGELGPRTVKSAERVARALGALETTIAKPGVTVGEQRIIRHPATRTPAQLARAASRATAARRSAVKAAKAMSGPQKALAEARKYIGKTESPAGSNTAPWGLSAWIKEFLGLSYGVPWCGILLAHCLRVAGVNVNGRMASVRYIYDDARAGRNGLEKLVSRDDARPGDLVGLFGLSTHVGMIVKKVPGGVLTREGNTSSGNSGSQSNGGGAYERVRPWSAVVYIARPRY